MIERKTTLILGAGASAPSSFPTGYKLLREVVEKITPYNLVPNYAVLEHANLLRQLGYDIPLISKFREALLKSGKTSVDAFLEFRPEFIPIGKAVIAIALIQCEQEKHLFKCDGKSWYEYLFNQLNTRFEEFDQNQLSILTFNYDRSLEHFLFTALKNASGKPDDGCAEKLKSIPIIHLHGDLGELPPLGNTLVRPYNTTISLEALRIATQRIKIIHEGVANDPQFQLAHKILSESEVVCFLGFGYHPLNMERLGIKNLKKSGINGKEIIGSSFGLTNAESKQIDGRYGFQLRPSQYEYQKLGVLQFLREIGVLFGNH
jgi:hypothetical protein